MSQTEPEVTLLASPSMLIIEPDLETPHLMVYKTINPSHRCCLSLDLERDEALEQDGYGILDMAEILTGADVACVHRRRFHYLGACSKHTYIHII